MSRTLDTFRLKLKAATAAALLFPALALPAQTNAPLPDPPTLLRDVMAHQTALEKLRENYTYLQQTVTREVKKDGSVKKTDSEDAQVFYVNTHEIARVVRKNGKDLSAGDEKKEIDRVAKEIDKAQHTPPGTSLNGDTVSVSRLLAIMKTSPSHHETIDGRGMIVFNFTGDEKAKTHGRVEDASKKVTGTVWVDEQDRQVRRLVAIFDGDYAIGFGILILAKGSSFTFDQKLVNSEVWLPTSARVHVIGKAFGVVGYRAEIQIEDSNYQRFHAQVEPAR